MILLRNEISILKKCHEYLCSPNKSHQKTGAGIEELFFFVSSVWENIICVVNTGIDIKEEEEARTTVFLTPAFNGIFETNSCRT